MSWDDDPLEEPDVEVDGVMVPAVAFRFRWFVADIGFSHRLDPRRPSTALCGHPWQDPEWEGPWDPPFAAPCVACDEVRSARMKQEADARRGRQSEERATPTARPAQASSSGSRRRAKVPGLQFIEPPPRKAASRARRTSSADKQQEESSRRGKAADPSRSLGRASGGRNREKVIPPPMPKRTEISLASASPDAGRGVRVVLGGLPSLGRRR